jgi:hypothetical protein
MTRILVMAKSPVPGQVKTRLAAGVGDETASDLAAAALLDTLAACHAAFPGECHLALAGDVAGAARGSAIRQALRSWHVFDQVGATFATATPTSVSVARTSHPSR